MAPRHCILLPRLLAREHYSQWQDTSDESDETDCLDLLTHDAYPCFDQITQLNH